MTDREKPRPMIPLGRLYYVASPYSKYPAGIEQAFRDISAIAARLLRFGYKVFSPIAHTHPIAIYGGIDPLNHDIWLPFDEAIIAKCDGIIVAMMQGWEESHGVNWEIERFKRDGKPVYYFDPSKDTSA